MSQQTYARILTWATANYTEAETVCDQAANLSAAEIHPVPFEPPTLADHATRELESLLLSRMEVRPGGLDPATPSRTREWLWRGLGAMLVADQPGSGDSEQDPDDDDDLPSDDDATDVLTPSESV